MEQAPKEQECVLLVARQHHDVKRPAARLPHRVDRREHLEELLLELNVPFPSTVLLDVCNFDGVAEKAS